MGYSDRTKTVRILSCCALAAVLAAAPGFAPLGGIGWDGAAYAKSDKAGGNGNGGNGNGGNGKGKGQSASGKSAAANGKAAKVASADGTLHPSQKGKWNAMNANQAALDAHIANGNFNGTIGALSQVQLAAMAASGDTAAQELMESYGFVDPDSIAEPSLEDLVAKMNELAEEGTSYSIDEDDLGNQSIVCEGDCTDQTAAEEAAQTALEEEAMDAAYDDALDAAKQRIIDESNKPLDEAQQEELFDEMGDKWGLDLTPEEELVEEAPVEGEELAEGEVPVEEEIVLVTE